MNKILKYSLFTLGGLVLLVLIVIGIVAATFNPNDYKPLIVKMVQEKKQRTLNIEGDIKLAFWPKLGADLGKISLSEHQSDKEFASVQGLKVSLALLPLLHKQLVVDTIYIDGARANIVRYKDGTTNFDDLISKDEEESQQIKFDIDGVVISSSAVTYTDMQAGKNYQVSNLDLKAGHIALAQPFDMETTFKLQASEPKTEAQVALNGNFMVDPDNKHYVTKGLDASVQGKVAGGKDVSIKLAGDIDAKPENTELLVDGLKLALSGNFSGAKLSANLEAPKLSVLKDEVSGKTASVNLNWEKGQDNLKANLQIADIKGSPKSVQSSGIKGDMTLNQGSGRSVVSQFSSPLAANLEAMVFDLPRLAGNINVKDAALPGGQMQGKFDLKLHADTKQERVSSEFHFNAEQSNLKGNVQVAGFAKPDIKFNVSADQLDLNKWLGTSTAAPAKEKKTAEAAKPTDLSALNDLKLQGKVNIGRIVYQKYHLADLNMAIDADGKQLKVNPFAVRLDDSSIKGSLGVSRYANPIYAFDMDIDKLDADRYITEPEGKKAETAAKSDPNAPIDLSALRQLNANGELRIGWLKLANVKSTNVRIKLKSDGGVAELSPFSANLYDGSMSGALKVDARTTPSIALKQDMKGINIGPLLVDAINNDMLAGKGNLNVDVTTQGNTVGEFKKKLDGTAALKLSDGAVKGIDIAGTLRGFKDKLNALKGESTVAGDKAKQTDFSEMSASFNIKK
ncbi:MAG TPA: AsmA family protein, partial [Methylophilaceae bacterium]|nr:AsmA family protein [Methylophilaceae bacterium]